MSDIEGDWNAVKQGPCACGYRAVWKVTIDDGGEGTTDDESDGSLPRKEPPGFEPPGFVAGIVESVKGLAGERRGSALGREE